MKRWLLVVATVLLGACDLDLTDIGHCEFERDLDDYVEAGSADVVRVFGEAGELRVEGVPGLDEVRVRGFACADTRRDLDDIELVVQRAGATVRVLALVPGISDGDARLDLVVEVPEWMLVEVDDESGYTEVRDVSGVFVFDGSGDLRIDGVAGDVEIEDGSGHIDVRRVDGDVWIWDESGDIDVFDIFGDLTVEHDTSGRITYRDVGGRVFLP